MTSFKFSYSLRGPHLQRQPYWGLGLQHTNFEEDTNLQSILSHFVSNYYHLPALNSTILTPHWEIHCWSWKQNFLPPTRDTEWRQKKKKIHPNSKYLRTWPSLPWLPTQMQTDTPEASATAALVYWAKIFATEILLFVVWLDFFFFFQQRHYRNRSLWTTEVPPKKTNLVAFPHFSPGIYINSFFFLLNFIIFWTT